MHGQFYRNKDILPGPIPRECLIGILMDAEAKWSAL